MAWLSGYTFRKKCTVVATAAGAQTDYQLELIVGESSGAAGEDVDCAGHCEDFPNDIRFTKEDGEEKHDYWVDTGSLTGVTPNRQVSVWIEVASIPAAGTIDFYIYYGKSGDGGESNGDDTFQFFDDFERGNDGDEIGGSWTEAGGTVEISTGQAYGGTRSMKLVGVTGIYPKASAGLVHGDDIVLRLRVYKEDAGIFYLLHGDGTKRQGIILDASENIKYRDDVGDQDTGSNITADQWELLEFYDYDWTSHTFDIYHNGNSVKNDADMETASSANNQLLLQGVNIDDADTWIDDIFVRKYASPEPTWGAWDGEEGRIFSADIGAGADAISELLAALLGSDMGVGTDDASPVVAAIQQSDLGLGLESETLEKLVYLLLKLLQEKGLNITLSQKGRDVNLKLSQEDKALNLKLSQEGSPR